MRSILVSCLLVGMFTAIACGADEAAPASAPVLEQPDISQICGRNSLYMLLRSYGYACSLADVTRVTPVGLAGTTLKELRDSAVHFGMGCDMVQTDLDTLERSRRYPSIVLIKSGGLIPDENGNAMAGHYLLLTGFSDGGSIVHLRDGTFGIPVKYKRERFNVVWTGVTLIPKAFSLTRLEFGLTLLNAAFWGGLFAYSKMSSRAGAQSEKVSSHAA